MTTPAAQPFTSFAPNTTAPVVMPLSEGDQGTIETVNQMWQLIQDGMRDPEVNRAAMAMITCSNARPFNFSDQRRAIFDWVRRNIRFVRDIAGKETLRTPRETLAVRAGDCDDMTMLLAALLGTSGNDIRIVTIGVYPGTPQNPAPFSHVYAEVSDGNQWVAIDPARPGARWGRGPERYTRKRIWFSTGEFSDVSGLASYGMGSPAAYLRRRAGMRGLGQDDGVDWSGIAQVITAGGTTASNVIRSVNNPYPALPTLTLAQQQALAAQQLNPLSSLSTIPPWMLIAGLALLAVAMVKR